jgi:hypothetical protein
MSSKPSAAHQTISATRVLFVLSQLQLELGVVLRAASSPSRLSLHWVWAQQQQLLCLLEQQLTVALQPGSWCY